MTPFIGGWAPQVALVVKNLPASAKDIMRQGFITGWEDPLEEGMATHSSILAWRIPQTEAWWASVLRVSKKVRYD